MRELSDTDYNICMMAIMKCQLIHRAVKVGLPCTLTSKNFGFPDMTDEEELELVDKLHEASELAWLRAQRGK
jgi:hypothetical protein